MKAGRLLMVVCFCIVCAFAAVAQSTGNVGITGIVVEEGSGIPVEQATVRLLTGRDSTFVGGVASGKNGSFTLKDIRPGNYLLHITFIGFEPLYQPLQLTGRTPQVNLGKLEMTDGSVMLGEAVVVGKAAEVVVRNDTIEYNADSYKVTEGSVLEDLLKKMPGVEIDDAGKVTVNGKEVKKVLVDGKEFFSDDPKVATKNLPSTMVDKVQVLQRLSEMSRMTGFDDGEEETVINLTVKPGMKSGWFGNAFAGAGKDVGNDYGNDTRYEGNAMVNRFMNNDQVTVMGGANNINNAGFSDLASTMFEGMGGGGGGGFRGFGGRNGITSSWNIGANMSKQFNPLMELGGNGRFSHSDNETVSTNRTDNFRENGQTTDFTNRYLNNKSDNAGANFRMEWKPDSATTVIFRPNFSYSHTNQFEESDSRGMNAAGDTTYIGSSNYQGEGDSYNLNGQLEFSRNLNDNGRILSASLSGGYSSTESDGFDQSTTNYYVDRDDILRDQYIRNDNSGFNYRAYLSWVEPIGNNNFVQLAYMINQRKQDQFKNAYNKDNAGDYSEIDTTQTQNYRNNFINQRASLSFKSVRAKFNYTIGFNMDPSYTNNERFIGDSILYNRTQNVINFSPTAQFRFNFSKQSNLRIDYDGRTSQPSMSQMIPVPDYTNPVNTRIGNPELKPRYSNNLFIRYQTFKPESQTAFMVMADGNYVINDIVNYTIYATDGSNYRATTYENANGNFSGNLRMMINTPLKNKKFTVGSMTMASYSNRTAFEGSGNMDDIASVTKIENTSKNLVLMERASFDFRSNFIDLGINGNISYNDARYSSPKTENQQLFNYGVGGRTTIYLPYNFKIESDITWSANSGYDSGYELNEALWNASASKSFLKSNALTLRLKFYDILQQRSSISNSVTANSMSYTEYNTLGSYFMAHLVYRFSIFKGGATMNDAFGGRRGGPGGRGPGGPPPGRF